MGKESAGGASTTTTQTTKVKGRADQMKPVLGQGAGGGDLITVKYNGNTFSVSRNKLKGQGWSDARISKYQVR